MSVAKTRFVPWESDSDQILGGVVHFSTTRPFDGTVTSPFFLSTDISVESMEDERAWQIYKQTRSRPNSKATGIAIGTKGMDTVDWEAQNVMGRLIAIAAALSNRAEMNEGLFKSHHADICINLACDESLAIHLASRSRRPPNEPLPKPLK